MRCPKCHANLGEGMLPARCPKCGANLAVGTDVRGAAQEARRATASYVSQDSIPRRSGSGLLGNILRVLVALLLVGVAAALVGFVLYQNEMWGGHTIPDVSGMRLELAQERLEEVGFSARSEVRKDDGQPGIVLEMSPAPGERAPEGTQILLVVSEQRTMPDVVGKAREEAQALMDAEGIPCEYTEEVSDEAEGTVLASTSPAGTVLTSQALVTLRVAKARTVPEVVGLDEVDAKALLADVGVEVKITYVDVKDTAQDGRVASSNPAVGAVIHKGDVVQLTVNRARIEHLKKAAEAVLRAVYDCADPSAGDSPIGAALKPYVEPSVHVSGETTAKDASNRQIWYGIVKRWQQTPAGVPEGFEALPRSVVAIEGVTATNEGHVTAAVTVRWDWSALGEGYVGVTSTDTHYVSMDFNDQDLLVAFWDEQTDMPSYEVVTESAEGEDSDAATDTGTDSQ